jgi:di/tricarboxylate transporter
MTLRRNFKMLNLVLAILTCLVIILTASYWIYCEFISEKFISNSYDQLRKFIYYNGIREIFILIVFLCTILSFISMRWGKNKKIIFLFLIALIVEILMINQLQIYKGP